MRSTLLLRRLGGCLFVILALTMIYQLLQPTTSTPNEKRRMVSMPAFQWKGEIVEGCELEICKGKQRPDLISEQCKDNPLVYKSFKPHDPSSYYRFIFDDKHKVLFCAVTKSLTTSFYRMFYESVTGKKLDYVHCRKCWFDQNLGWLDRLSIKEIEKRLNSYYKIMLVRHPLDRLRLSWKRGLVTQDDDTGLPMKELGKKILVNYREHVDEVNVDEAVDGGVEFEEFIKYVVDVEEDENSEHHRAWIPMHQMCHPCAVKFDFVAKMETIHEDAAHILSKVNMSVSKSHLGKMIRDRGDIAHKLVRRRLNDFDFVDKDLTDRILEIYKHDFELFDYHWDGETAACGHCTGEPAGRCC